MRTRRFSGSGLGATEEVAAFQEQRDRLGLDGGRSGVVEFVENLFQGRGKSHRFKCRSHVYFLKASSCRYRQLAGIDEME